MKCIDSIKILRWIFYFLASVCFLSGAVAALTNSNGLYANYLYLSCAISFVIGVLFDGYLLWKEL